MLTKSRSSLILLVAILIGIAADRLFFDKQLGISLLLFVLLFSGGLIFLARRSGTPVARHNLWLFVPLFFFAAMVAVRDNSFVNALNVLWVAGLLAYLVLYYAAGRVGEFGLLTAAILPGYAAGKSVMGAAPIVSKSVEGSQLIRNGRGNLLAIIRGSLLAVPLLLVFTLLLASADLVFAYQVVNLINPRHITYLLRLNIHGLFIFGAFWVAAGGLALALNGRDDAAAFDQQITRLRRFRFVGATESTTLLVLVDLLFLSFITVQFRYLFGGQANITLSGDIYGTSFYELLLVVILSLGVIMGLGAMTNPESKPQFKPIIQLFILFLLFVVALAFGNLFGSQAGIDVTNYTYAEYARRGFFELLLVATLSLGVILGLEAVTNRQSKRQFKVFNLLSSAMIVLVIIMLVSAFQRMRLYEATFGYTELRLYVYVFMVWLGLFLAWFLFGLWRRPGRFALGALIIGMGFVVTLNLLNPEAFIVRQNIARFRAGGDLDALYLESLSNDAVPALVAAMTSDESAQGKILSPLCPDQTSRVPEACEISLSEVLEAGLKDRLEEMQNDSQWRRWQSFRLSNWRAYRLLSTMFA